MKRKTITDKERLDWLDKQDGAIIHEGYGEYSHYFGGIFETARETIDKAINDEKNRNKTTRT